MTQEMTGFWGGSSISWTICKQSAPRSRQKTTQHLITQFLQARCSFQRPTNSVKALKAHVSLNTNARYSLYFTMGFSETPKIAPYKWRIQAPSETWYVGDTKVQNANGMSIGSSISAQTALVTDRHTNADRDTFVSIGCKTSQLVLGIVTMTRPENDVELK